MTNPSSERSSDLPEVTQPVYIAGTQIWYPSVGAFSLAEGGMWGWGLSPCMDFSPDSGNSTHGWLACRLTHVTCELVSDELLEQGVPFHTCPLCGIKEEGCFGCGEVGASTFWASCIKTEDCVYSNRVMAAFTVISRKLSHSEILPRSLADGVVLGRS